MNRIFRLIRYFMRARKCWHWPSQSQVLIYDASGQEILQEYLQPWKPEVLHMRGEQINMPVLLAVFFRNGNKSDAYVDIFISKVRPRLIVTFTDNNPGFYSLGRRHGSIKTLFIQNGYRGYYDDVFENLDCAKFPVDSRRVDYMLTFGSRIGHEYSRYIQGAVVPTGSVKNNMVPKSHAARAGTIAFVSQYRNTEGFSMGGKFYSRQAFFEQADHLVLSFLMKYARNHGKSVYIVPCTGHYEDEELKKKEREYYNDLLGHGCVFSEWRWHGSGYDSADMAEVVVSIDSTLGYESAARGNKTAIFSIRTQQLGVTALSFGWPESYSDDGKFWTNRPDPATFGRVLDHLFSIDHQQWNVELEQQGFKDIMAYDPGNGILKSVLQKVLGSGQSQIH